MANLASVKQLKSFQGYGVCVCPLAFHVMSQHVSTRCSQCFSLNTQDVRCISKTLTLALTCQECWLQTWCWKQPGYPDTRISGCSDNNPDILVSDTKINGYPGIRTSGYADIWISGYPVSGHPDIRISGCPDTRTAHPTFTAWKRLKDFSGQ